MKFNFEILPFCKQLSFPYLKNGFVINNEKIGKKIPIPLPVIGNKIYAPNRYIKSLLWYKKFNCNKIKDDIVYMPRPFNLVIYYHYLEIMATEFNQWLKYYRPPNDNEIIIDVGAGCGETAYLYYTYFNPKSVISIEPDKNKFDLLQTNSKINNWPNHILINDILRIEHLDRCTFAKIDIEGSERYFHDYLKKSKLPFVMETHYNTINQYSDFKQLWNNHRGCALVKSS